MPKFHARKECCYAHAMHEDEWLNEVPELVSSDVAQDEKEGEGEHHVPSDLVRRIFCKKRQ